MEKIVDMPLITSSNLISVVQRNTEPGDSDDSKNKTSESNVTNAERSPECGKSDKKSTNWVPPQSQPTRKRDDEKSRLPAQASSNGVKIECDFAGKMARKERENDKGIELTLTPLKNEASDDAAESDRSMLLVRGKEANKISVSLNVEGRKLVRDDPPLLEVRKVEGEATPAGKKFSFEESRESAGEPDGKADEEQVTEPPALPKSPPPVEARSPLQGETHKTPIITTEPRPSFLHGVVHATESKLKPTVPQKPTNFLAKVGAVAPSDGNTKKSHVLAPLPIQSAGGKPVAGENLLLSRSYK